MGGTGYGKITRNAGFFVFYSKNSCAYVKVKEQKEIDFQNVFKNIFGEQELRRTSIRKNMEWKIVRGDAGEVCEEREAIGLKKKLAK